MTNKDKSGSIFMAWGKRNVPPSKGDTFNVDNEDLSAQKKTRYQQDTEWRKYFSIWVMTVVPTWLVSVIVLVYISILGNYHIASSILNTLLATTTINILGLAYIVLKGIFPQERK